MVLASVTISNGQLKIPPPPLLGACWLSTFTLFATGMMSQAINTAVSAGDAFKVIRGIIAALRPEASAYGSRDGDAFKEVLPPPTCR
jgi:hypothetical protein